MARQTKLNPESTLLGFGAGVRLERGPDKPEPGSPSVWVLYSRTDVSDDPDTTYTYRFDEVRRFTEAEDAPGEPPQAALDAAQALAGQE
jgi:hypothetical protein